MPNALQMLHDDHKRVKDLFKQFEDAENARTKGAIVDEALRELEIHAELEEEIFYPAVRQEADPDDGHMDEAEEEHHVVKLLIAELRKMKPGDQRYDAKFTVLSENVKHHIEEEESEMLPKAAELGTDRMNELGAEMEARKLQLAAKTRTSTGRAAPGRVSTRSSTRTKGATGRTTQKGLARVKGASRAAAKRKTAGRRTSTKASSRAGGRR